MHTRAKKDVYSVDTQPCIVMFSALYLPSVGGVETYTSQLANALQRQGCRVIIITCNTHNGAAREQCHNVEIVRLPCHPLLQGRYPLLRKNKEFRTLWDWLSEQSISHVLINTRFYTLSLEGLAFAQKQHLMPVVIEHGSAHLTLGSTLADKVVEGVEHGITTLDKRHPARYFAVSRKASEWLGHFGIASQGELANSIDADAYLACASERNFRHEAKATSDTFLVAFVGRLVQEKGILALAQASKLLPATSTMVILVAGSGPLKDELEAFASKKFLLLGNLERGDVAALLSQANVLCLPSRSEGFATTLLEAAACYTPAITTNIGGVDELIPCGEYGTVVPDAQSQTIANALLQASEHPEQTKQQGRAVGALVRQDFSWENTALRALDALTSSASIKPTSNISNTH